MDLLMEMLGIMAKILGGIISKVTDKAEEMIEALEAELLK